MHGLHEEHRVTCLGSQARYAGNVQVRAFGSEKKLRVEIHGQNDFAFAVTFIHFQEAAGHFVFNLVKPQSLFNFLSIREADGRIVSDGRVNIFRVKRNGNFDAVHSNPKRRRGNRRVAKVAGNVIGQKTFRVGYVKNIFDRAESVRTSKAFNRKSALVQK